MLLDAGHSSVCVCVCVCVCSGYTLQPAMYDSVLFSKFAAKLGAYNHEIWHVNDIVGYPPYNFVV